jgi:hypothetical protein
MAFLYNFMNDMIRSICKYTWAYIYIRRLARAFYAQTGTWTFFQFCLCRKCCLIIYFAFVVSTRVFIYIINKPHIILVVSIRYGVFSCESLANNVARHCGGERERAQYCCNAMQLSLLLPILISMGFEIYVLHTFWLY